MDPSGSCPCKGHRCILSFAAIELTFKQLTSNLGRKLGVNLAAKALDFAEGAS